MSEDAIRQWLIECFGPVQGEQAFQQLSMLPDALREQLMSQDSSSLPSPEQMKQMMQMFMGGNTPMGSMFGMGEPGNAAGTNPAGFHSANAGAPTDAAQSTAQSPTADENAAIDVNIAKTIAGQYVNGEDSEQVVTAGEGETMRRAMSEANLWLDTATEFNPVDGEASVLTRSSWLNGTIEQWPSSPLRSPRQWPTP